jgi:hypothetical protein
MSPYARIEGAYANSQGISNNHDRKTNRSCHISTFLFIFSRKNLHKTSCSSLFRSICAEFWHQVTIWYMFDHMCSLLYRPFEVYGTICFHLVTRPNNASCFDCAFVTTTALPYDFSASKLPSPHTDPQPNTVCRIYFEYS